MNELLEKGTKYTNRGRAIYANLHDPKNEDFRKNILNGSLSEETIVTMDVKEMANQKLKSEREKLEKDIFNSLRTDWNDEQARVGGRDGIAGRCLLLLGQGRQRP